MIINASTTFIHITFTITLCPQFSHTHLKTHHIHIYSIVYVLQRGSFGDLLRQEVEKAIDPLRMLARPKWSVWFSSGNATHALRLDQEKPSELVEIWLTLYVVQVKIYLWIVIFIYTWRIVKISVGALELFDTKHKNNY